MITIKFKKQIFAFFIIFFVLIKINTLFNITSNVKSFLNFMAMLSFFISISIFMYQFCLNKINKSFSIIGFLIILLFSFLTYFYKINIIDLIYLPVLYFCILFIQILYIVNTKYKFIKLN